MNITQILLSGLANYRTTVVGLLAGTINLGSTVGAQIPRTRADWAAFVVSALIAVLGLLAKDSVTGSQPANVVAPVPAPSKQGPAVTAELVPVPTQGSIVGAQK